MKSLQKNLVRFISMIACALFLSAIATTFTSVKTLAADATGGSSFDSAMQISPGQYYGPSLPVKQSAFYKISVNAGQELTFEGSFTPEMTEYGGTANTIKIFNEDRTELVSVFNSSDTSENVVTATTLASAQKPTQTYYVQVTDEAWGTASSVLDVTVADRFDAGSNTDAGQTIDNALGIQTGLYAGYMSQVDTDDYYVLPVSAGKLSVRVTPNSKMTPYVELYDQNGGIVGTTMAQGPGEAIVLTANVDAGNAYVHLKCGSDTGCGSAAVDYKFEVVAGDAVLEVVGQNNTQAAAKERSIWGDAMMWVFVVVAGIIAVAVGAIVVAILRRNKNRSSMLLSKGSTHPDSQSVQPVQNNTEDNSKNNF